MAAIQVVVDFMTLSMIPLCKMNELILACTGHRSDKLGGYNPEAIKKLDDFVFVTLPLYQPSKVILGMALGFDQAVAKACVKHTIPFIAAIPFEGQEIKWPKASQLLYLELLEKSSELVIVCEGGYAPWKMQKRNEWMCDHATALLSLWNGSSGGTGNCVKYAEKKDMSVYPLWKEWEKYV